MARKGSYDFSKGINTRAAVRRTPQEDIDAARVRAAGAPAPPYDPAEHARLGRVMEDRATRWVMGRYENKGRSPMVVLSHAQFAELHQTGDVAGLMPDYGPHVMAPEDKEYETDF